MNHGDTVRRFLNFREAGRNVQGRETFFAQALQLFVLGEHFLRQGQVLAAGRVEDARSHALAIVKDQQHVAFEAE